MLWYPAEFLWPHSVVYCCVISQPHRLTQIAWSVTPVHFYRLSKINKTRSRTLFQTGSTPTCCECELFLIIWNHQATGGALLTEAPSACDLQFILHLCFHPNTVHQSLQSAQTRFLCSNIILIEGTNTLNYTQSSSTVLVTARLLWRLMGNYSM